MVGQVQRLKNEGCRRQQFSDIPRLYLQIRDARWPCGRASDSGARGRGFDPHSGRSVVSLSKIHVPHKNTGNTQKAVALSRHDRKNVDCDVKSQPKQTNKYLQIRSTDYQTVDRKSPSLSS